VFLPRVVPLSTEMGILYELKVHAFVNRGRESGSLMPIEYPVSDQKGTVHGIRQAGVDCFRNPSSADIAMSPIVGMKWSATTTRKATANIPRMRPVG
jgi:hypothetical protein